MKPLVIYHKSCVDGAMAAAVAYLRFGEEADYVPASYQRDSVSLDRAVGAEVYILDFSFPRADLLALADVAARVVVADHHKTSAWLKEMSHPKVEVVFGAEECGASLADRFFGGPGESEYDAVAYARDYDLWRHEMPDSKAVHAYFYSFLDGTSEEVRVFARHLSRRSDAQEWIVEGNAILRANLQQARRLAKHPEIVTFAGIEAPAVNSPVFQNDVCDFLAAASPIGVGICWGYRQGRYKVSLRSRPVSGKEEIFDCSAVAAIYGGGGQRGAAGFECDRLPWEEDDAFIAFHKSRKETP